MSNAIKMDFLKELGEATPYKEGRYIFRRGEPGDRMFAIISGSVDISVDGTTVSKLKEGDIFGEMALIDHQERSADAVAASDCTLIPIDEQLFLIITENMPQFALHLLRLNAARLRGRMADIEALKSIWSTLT